MLSFIFWISSSLLGKSVANLGCSKMYDKGRFVETVLESMLSSLSLSNNSTAAT
ncbi:hypothetical protein [Sulfolobus tengchongensis spindle-shaped virus 3]|nr:hypothetical protein [Sulfolobus tengchongensis spindle-shaped virus 3]